MFVNDSRSDGTDVHLSAGANGKQIPAHKAVLSSKSEYFKFMFSGSFKESIESTVVIPDIESETLEAIIEFIYCGSVEISNHVQAIGLLKSAHLMELPQLLKFSEDYLEENMTVDTCFEIWSLAKLYNRDNLFNKATDLMAIELKSFSQRDEFKELDKDLLVELITEWQESTFEDNIAVGVLSWLDFDKSRLIYYKEFLQLLKIECIKRDATIDELVGNCTKKEEWEIIIKALMKRSCSTKIIKSNNSKQQKLLVLVGSNSLYEYDFSTKSFTKKDETMIEIYHGDVLGFWEGTILYKENRELVCYNHVSKTTVTSSIEQEHDPYIYPGACARVGDNIYFLLRKQMFKWNLMNNSKENIVPPEEFNCYKFEAMCEMNGVLKIFAGLKKSIEILAYNPLNNIWSIVSEVSNIEEDDLKRFSILVALKNRLCYFTQDKLHMFNLYDRKWSSIEHCSKFDRNIIRNIVSVGDKLIVLTCNGLYEYIEDKGELEEIYSKNLNIRAISCNKFMKCNERCTLLMELKIK